VSNAGYGFIGVFMLVMMLAATITPGSTTNSPLALHPDNPHYFIFRGKPAILITSAEHYGALLNLDFDYVKYLETLQRGGLNHTRTFTGAAYLELPGSFNIAKNTLAPGTNRYISPWSRSSTPGYINGGNKFDLSKWNEDYFRRLNDFMSQASKRGIVVELNLFCPFYREEEWQYSPFHPHNNVNGLGNVSRSEVYTLDKHGGLLEVQERFVRKVVSELKDFDNLYYEICNEPYAGNLPQDWQHRIVDVIVEAEKNFAGKHLISLNVSNFSKKVENPHPAVSIFNFHYATPPVTVELNYGLNKVIGDNETGFRGVSDEPYRMEAWDFIVAGGGIFNHLDYSFTAGHEDGSFKIPATQPGGGTPELRKQLRILRDFIYGFDFIRMRPDNSVIKTGIPDGTAARALVEEGKSYAIYLRPMTYAQFSARWTGLIEPKVSGEHTFFTRSNDGVRLWIDDKPVIDNWTDHSETEDSGKIGLEAGKKYRIRMEYFYNGGWGVTRLFWSAPGQAREIVPATAVSQPDGWKPGLLAEYFNGVDLKERVLTRTDANVNFTWGTGLSPFAYAKPAKTVLTIEIPAGTYRAEWIDTKSGAVAGREEFSHNGGSRKLNAPDYQDDIALRVLRK
jgi:hypothetical protein